jgi:hypothetical protein
MKLTDEQRVVERKKYELWFQKANSWGLTGRQFLDLLYQGKDGGEVVHVHETGASLTQAMACDWWRRYCEYWAGWLAKAESEE